MSGVPVLKPGQTVYVKARNTRLYPAPMATSTPLGLLQPGAMVSWLGWAEESREYHQVKAGNKVGFIYFLNLSLHFPAPEYTAGPSCPNCRGAGYVLPNGIDPAVLGNNFVYPVCPMCKGTGYPPGYDRAYQSFGATRG